MLPSEEGVSENIPVKQSMNVSKPIDYFFCWGVLQKKTLNAFQDLKMPNILDPYPNW